MQSVNRSKSEKYKILKNGNNIEKLKRGKLGKMLNYKNDMFNKLIFTYIILDFLLTYMGINYIGCIQEGNPIMVWLFELPFVVAFIIRIIIGTIIYLMYKFIQKSAEKAYKKIVAFALIAENLVLFLHLRWLILYLS